jgi:hypothetical protein
VNGRFAAEVSFAAEARFAAGNYIVEHPPMAGPQSRGIVQ